MDKGHHKKKHLSLPTLQRTAKGYTGAVDPLHPIHALREKLNTSKDLKSLIEVSLRAAIEASSEINSTTRDALQWPSNTDEYLQYLKEFAHWIPQQSGAEAFQVSGNPDEYQEVYIRLCHFYFLIDQPVREDSQEVVAQLDPWFREWLVVYADYWGVFLDTPDSFNDKVLESFRHYAPQYKVEDSMIDVDGDLVPNNASGWQTFNQFFARTLNGGLRPISHPMNNHCVTAPADCTFMEAYRINDKSIVESDQAVLIKGTHPVGDINQLLQGSEYKDKFAGGTFVHYFLNTFSYHRFHAPVNGKLVESRAIQGLVYLDVKIKNGQFDAPDSAEDGYEFYQSRGLTIWDTAGSSHGDIGLVACLPTGMAQVSSVILTGTKDCHFQKGDEFGYFQFGGSDIILLFQAGRVESLLEQSQTKYLHYGTPVVKCTSPK